MRLLPSLAAMSESSSAYLNTSIGAGIQQRLDNRRIIHHTLTLRIQVSVILYRAQQWRHT